MYLRLDSRRIRCDFPPIRQLLPPPDGLDMLGIFVAFASALWIAVYFTTSIRRYVDRAHAELRQKEKMLGIGQLVAGIAHQIANPLDGVQNCLRRIGERVKDDPHLTEYVQLMAEALERIERTAKRVQAFARPRGITLQSTDVNQAVEATLDVLGASPRAQHPHREGTGRRGPGPRRPLHACRKCSSTSAPTPWHAMPNGGTLTLRTLRPGQQGRGPDGLGGHRRQRHGRGHPAGEPGEDFRAVLHHPRRYRRHRPGLGLCRMLISEMGGRIEVRSALGQGTTFTVVLNRADLNEIPLARTRERGRGEGG